MAFNKDIASSELDWMNDSCEREIAFNENEARDLSDWQEEDAILRDQARKEAAEANQWPMTCDGSGILNYETDCKGCPACDEELTEFPGYHKTRILSDMELALMTEAMFTRRKPMTAETSDGQRKEVA